jgi:hypothetical protein
MRSCYAAILYFHMLIWLALSFPRETESMVNLETNHTGSFFHAHCLRKGIVLGSAENNQFIDNAYKQLLNQSNYFSYVSEPRIRATYVLAQAALMLPYQGDFVETGLARGGSAAAMLQVLHSFDSCGTKFWGYDSFEGIPDPSPGEGDWGSKKRKGTYASSQQEFEQNIRNWNLWNDSMIHVTKGWFRDTLPKSEVGNITFLRLDGDLYASTRDAIMALYDRVVPGGYIYVDDYGSFYGCRLAIDEFRTKYRIFEPMHYVREKKNMRYIHFEAVWWKKRSDH